MCPPSFKHNTSFVSRLSTIRRHKSPNITSNPANNQALPSAGAPTSSGSPTSKFANEQHHQHQEAHLQADPNQAPLVDGTKDGGPLGEPAAEQQHQPQSVTTAAGALYAPLALVGATSKAIDMDTITALSSRQQQQQRPRSAVVTVTSSSPCLPSSDDLQLLGDSPQLAGEQQDPVTSAAIDATKTGQTAVAVGQDADSVQQPKHSLSVSSLIVTSKLNGKDSPRVETRLVQTVPAMELASVEAPSVGRDSTELTNNEPQLQSSAGSGTVRAPNQPRTILRNRLEIHTSSGLGELATAQDDGQTSAAASGDRLMKVARQARGQDQAAGGGGGGGGSSSSGRYDINNNGPPDGGKF